MEKKSKPILNCNSHIYLYAKGHYVKSHVINDMKRILGERAGIGAEHISQKDIVMVLFPLMYLHLKDSENLFCRFLENLFPAEAWEISKESPLMIVMVKNCLSVLRFVQVLDGDKVLLELDEPDENILPFSENKLNEIRRGTSKTYPEKE